MWIPYDLTGSIKAETPAETIQRAKDDRTVRDVIVGFFVRNPVTQSWEIDVRIGSVGRMLAVDLDGMPAEIAFYGDEAGKLNEAIYRVKAADPFAALAACRGDMEERLARWAVELGRGMAVAGWRMADPVNEARWRSTPFRPSALDLDLDALDDAPDDVKPLLNLYQRARNATDPAWRLVNAYAILNLWRAGEAPFSAPPERSRTVSFEMLVHSGAIASAPELRNRPLTEFVDMLRTLRHAAIAELDRPVVHHPGEAERTMLSSMANLADLAARETLLFELARRRTPGLALAS